MRGVELNGVEIYGEIGSLTVNGVDIGPLVNAELDRRYPDRVKMRPTDAAGFREAWDVIERLWGDTVERARRMEPELLHTSVDGEWTFIETLRHLVFATDAWFRRRDPRRSVAVGSAGPSVGRDARHAGCAPRPRRTTDARRSARAAPRPDGHRAGVIEGLTDESLSGNTEPVDAPGWPHPISYPVRECVLCVLNEEWEHRLYAERDLDALDA